MATYREPRTTITIIEQSPALPAGTPSLNACIVGPGFEVTSEDFLGIYDASSAIFPITGLTVGSEVDEDTIDIYITNTVDGIQYTITDSEWTYSNDAITMDSGIVYEIASGADGNSVAGETYQFASTGVDFSEYDIKHYDSLDIDGGGTYTVVGLEGSKLLLDTPYLDGDGQTWSLNRLLLGNIYISLRALRTDIVGDLLYFEDQADVISQAGGIDAIIPENPLFYGAYLATAFAPCYATGVDDLPGYKNSDDTVLTAWNAAFLYLRQFDYLYAFAILSKSAAVHGSMQVFVDWMSDPENGQMCVAYASSKEVTEEEGVPYRYGAEVSIDGTLLTDPGINYGLYDLSPGCYVTLYNVTANTSYNARVLAVGATTLTFYTAVPATWRDNIFYYRVVKDFYNESQQANYMKQYGESFEDKRVRIAWPENISFSGNTNLYPSYYIYCERVGKIAAQTNPSQPYTRDVVRSGINRVYLPFRSRTLLNTIASGGIEIFTQDQNNLPVYSRHQLTTDMTDNVRKEQSLVHSVDHAALLLVDAVDQNTGKYVIDQALMDALRVTVGSVADYLTKKIRSIESLTISKLEQDTTDPSVVLMEVQVTPLYPYNGSTIIMYVS
jgi:hypothetical protein